MLNAWIPTSRKSEKMRHSFKTTIEIALPDVNISKDAPLKEWALIVKYEDKWEAVIDSSFNNA